MQTLGELLRTTREERGYTVDQVIHETNISRSYIENLEAEFFDEFPAEAYLIGFLRTYASYLGLDPEKVISLYRNHKLREEPAPLEALVGKKQKSIPPFVFIIVGAVVILAVAGYFFYPLISTAFENRAEQRQILANENKERLPMEFTIDKDETEFHAMDGDSLIFNLSDKSFIFLVSDRGNGLELSKKDAPDDPGHFLNLGKEEFISLFQDSPDYRIYLKDYGFTEGGGVLVIQKISQTELQREVSDAPLDVSQIDTTAPSGVQSRTVEPFIIYTAAGGERYTLDIKFRGYCLLRYQKDHDDPIQKYYKDGDTLRAEVNSKIELWLSNAGSVYAKVNGVELDFGDAGEVTAKKIQWAKNATGQYELLLLHVY
jgi:cytoskeleton protein RodZ